MLYVLIPKVPHALANTSTIVGVIYHILVKKYFVDFVYDVVLVKIFLFISVFLWKVVDIFIIDKTIVHEVHMMGVCAI